jgi:L-lactate dehydrogenase complex protein LldF
VSKKELESFLEASDIKAFDPRHRQIINNNIGKYNAAVSNGRKQYDNYELARTRAAMLKWKVLENLDKYLLEFEANTQRKGTKVIWCEDVEGAQKELLSILKSQDAKMIVKAKSMATEEIDLNELLKHHGIESIETDLGEYIQQLDGEKPYHIVTPAMHKSKEDIAQLFHEKLGTPLDLTPEQMSLHVRKLLREKYTQAKVGITGANFLIADTGSISITENEGNARLTTAFPKVHVVIVGIEKIIPNLTDLDLFLPLLATAGTGQKLTAYNTIISGPANKEEADGPKEMYVLLLDNGRTELLAQHEQRQALGCIRCGACLNACPVYKNIGGHSYQTTYTGPIGSVITPHLRGMEDYKHLSYASTLCGNCTEVCPVKIDIHNLLLFNRRDAVKKKLNKWTETNGWKLWRWGMMERRRMNKSSGLKNSFMQYFFKEAWGDKRETPVVAEKSFNEQWKALHPGGEK